MPKMLGNLRSPSAAVLGEIHGVTGESGHGLFLWSAVCAASTSGSVHLVFITETFCLRAALGAAWTVQSVQHLETHVLVCCLRLVPAELPSAPGTLTYNLASCFQSKKSVYFTLLDFTLVLKGSLVPRPGMDTTSRSYHCPWRWPPPVRCYVRPGSTPSRDHLTSGSVEWVLNNIP